MGLEPLPLSQTGRTPAAIAAEAARTAGRIIMDLKSQNQPVEIKGRGNVATLADSRAEAAILEILRREFPEYGILAEESGQVVASSEYQWIIDPLDGTYNYSISLPIYCVSVALARNGRPVAGVIYDPNRDELFSATAGQGATLNNAAMAVSPVSELQKCALGFDLGYHDERGRRAIEIGSTLWGRIQFFRTIGSSALGLAYVAAGRFDLYFHHWVYPWDYAAGWLLVEEAGGTMTGYGGAPFSFEVNHMVAGNSALHAAFLDATKHLGPLPD